MTFKEFFRLHPFQTLLVILEMIISSFMIVLNSYALTWEFNALRAHDLRRFLVMILFQFSTMVLNIWLIYLSNVTWEKLTQDYLHVIRQALALHAFNNRKVTKVASLQNNLLQNCNLLAGQYLLALRTCLHTTLVVIGTGTALLTFHWSLFLTAILFALLQLYLPRVLDRHLNQATDHVSLANKRYLKTLNHWLGGLSEVRRYVAGGWFESVLSASSSKLEQAKIHQRKMTSYLDYLNQLAYTIGDTLLLLLTAFLIINKWTPFGLISSIGNFNGIFFGNLQFVANNWGQVQGTRTLRQKISQQRRQIESNDSCGEIPAGFRTQGLSVAFDDGLKITYPDLMVLPGEKVLLTGDSGSGKSTLFKLLLGSIAVKTGKIIYYDYQGKAVIPALSEIGYLPQDPQLFPGTIAENMTMFNAKLNAKNALSKVVDRVRLTVDLANFKAGLETYLDLEQQNVSGGQRQKIVLARSYWYGSQMILVDEGTSAIDHQAALAILDHLLKTDRTILFIAHHVTADVRSRFDREVHLSATAITKAH